MSYLFSTNTNVTNSVEVQNDQGNSISVSLFNSNSTAITAANPLPVTIGSNSIMISGNVNIGPTVNIGAVLSTVNVAVQGNVAGITSNVAVQGSLVVNSVTSNVTVQGSLVVNSVTSNVTVQGSLVVNSVTSNVTVQGSLQVNNFPATQNVQVLSNTTNYVFTQAAPTWSVDALSKLRVSAIQNQDFFTPVVDDDTTYKWSQANVGTLANSSFYANTSEISMTSGNSASGSVIRQTYVKYKIIPGTSHTVYTTVNFSANSTESGVTRRTGLFDSNDGIFWEQNANTLAVVVRRTLVNGSIVEDRTYANSFNTDKLDGTGPSGFNIFSKGLNYYYTFWFDMIGGRTGRIRFGMGGPNGPQICHVQSYSGVNAQNTNFISAASLPLRREIFNSTVQPNIPYFNMSGIAYQAEAPTRYNSSPATAYNINGYVPATTLTPILTIGLRSGAPYDHSDLSPGEFTLVEQNNQGKNATAATFLYTVVYNATINGTYAYAGNSSVSNSTIGRSARQWTWSNTATISGGLTVLSGVTQSGIGQQIFDGLPDTFNLGSDINDNPATLTICIQQLTAGGSSSNVVCTWNFVEQL